MKRRFIDNKKMVWLSTILILLLQAFLMPLGVARADSDYANSFYATLPAGSVPSAIVYGPQQSYWLPQMKGNAISRFQPPGNLEQIALNIPDAGAYDAVVGADKAVYFTEKQAASIGRLQDGTITDFTLPNSDSDPTQIINGHTNDIWFSEYNASRIGHLAADGSMTEIALAENARPIGISNDVAGNIWFAEWGARAIGRITPQGELSEYPISSTVSRPTEICRDLEDDFWVLLDNSNKILRVATNDNTITSFTLNSALSSSFVDLAVGVDGKIWLYGTGSLASFEVTPAGPAHFTEIEIFPRIFEGEGRAQLIAGASSNMVFNHNNNDLLYQYQLPVTNLRDLQIVVSYMYPLVLAAGKFPIDLEVVNWSQADAEDISLTLMLDENIHFLGLSGYSLAACSEAEGQVICQLGTIPANSSLNLTAVYETTRLTEYAVERELSFQVDLAAGDYLPTNNRQMRALTVQESIDYFNDFSVSAEPKYWSHTHITDSPTASATLGRFSNDNVAITFSDLPPHDEISICFQLYVMGSWDGNQFRDPDVTIEPVPIVGPDIWANYIDDNRLVVATFSNQSRFNQSFPDNYRDDTHPFQSTARSIGDFDSDGQINDARYDLCYRREHSQATFRTTFYGVNLAGDQGETWSLDNVKAKIYYHEVYDWLYLPLLIP